MIADLSWLMYSPEYLENCCRVRRMLDTEEMEPAKQVVSSVNCDILHSSFRTNTPVMMLLFLIIIANNSTPITKRSGDAQHPCRTPLEGWKYSDVWPAFKIHVSGFLNSILMDSMNFSPKLKNFSALKLRAQLMESKAFL